MYYYTNPNQFSTAMFLIILKTATCFGHLNGHHHAAHKMKYNLTLK